jgi:hypothetical protein
MVVDMGMDMGMGMDMDMERYIQNTADNHKTY